MPTENVTFGTSFFSGRRVTPGDLEQNLQRIGTGLAIDRLSREGQIPFVLQDQSGGLDPRPGIWPIETHGNRFEFNQGIQTRLPGLAILPDLPTNQSSITSDENISSGVAANWRRHDVITSVGGSSPAWYSAFGKKLYRLNSGAWEVADSFTNVVTAMAELVVNGSRVLAVATNGTTDDVKYTSDPTGSISWTELITLSSGDYIYAMQWFPSLGFGVNIVLGEVGGVNQAWWISGGEAATWSMSPVVLAGTEDQPNDNNTEETLTGTAITTAMLFQNTSPGDSEAWSSQSNAVGSDGSDAANAFTSGNITDYLGIALPELGWTTEDIPDGVTLTSASITVEAAEGNAGDNVYFYDLAFWYDPHDAAGATAPDISLFFSDPNANAASRPLGVAHGEVSDSDTSYELALDEVQLSQITAAQFRKGALAFNFTDVAGTSPAINVDDISAVTVKFKRPGVSIGGAVGGGASTGGIPGGGFQIAPNPALPHRITAVAPQAQDLTGITESRELWYFDFTWDTSGGRPLVTLSQPNEGMENVWCATSILSGTLMAGGSTGVPGSQVKFINSSGNLLNYRFPESHGGERTAVNSVYAAGNWAVLDVIHYSSGTTVADRQFWYLNMDNGRYYPDFMLQSLSGLSISAAPIPTAIGLIDGINNQVYTVFPNSTDTAVQRVFCPPDPTADPRVSNTTEVKTDAEIYLETCRLSVGPEEANKVLHVVRFLGTEIDSTETVQVEISDDGGATYGVLDNTFTAAADADVGSAGAAYVSLQAKLTPAHASGTALTPNMLPIEYVTTQEWPLLRTFAFEVLRPSDLEPSGHVFDWLDDMITLLNTKAAQPLSFGDQENIPCRLLTIEWTHLDLTVSEDHFLDRDGNPAVMRVVFAEVPGSGS